MGERDSARLDVAAVRAAAERFDSVADELDRAARIPLTFDGSAAGRAHTADGDALRVALDRRTGELAMWARSAAEIAVGLRAGADRYVDADLGAGGDGGGGAGAGDADGRRPASRAQGVRRRMPFMFRSPGCGRGIM